MVLIIPMISLDTFLQIQPEKSKKDHFTPLKPTSSNGNCPQTAQSLVANKRQRNFSCFPGNDGLCYLMTSYNEMCILQ